ARDHVASHWSASHTQFWSAVRYGAIATCEKPVIDEEPFKWAADGEDWSLFEAAQQPWNAEVWRQRSENAERKRLCSASKATAKFSKLDLTALIVAKDLQTPAAVMAYTQDHGTRKMQEWVCQNQRKLGEYVEEASDWQQARDRSNAEKETEWALLCRMAGQAKSLGVDIVKDDDEIVFQTDKRFLFFDDFRPIEYAQGTIDAFRNGNEDFAWRKGCCLTAKEKELWAPWGKVSEEDVQRMKNRQTLNWCCSQVWPLGVASLLAKLPNEKVEALSAELTALGAVLVREVSAADWTTLTAFNSLLPFERRPNAYKRQFQVLADELAALKRRRAQMRAENKARAKQEKNTKKRRARLLQADVALKRMRALRLRPREGIQQELRAPRLEQEFGRGSSSFKVLWRQTKEWRTTRSASLGGGPSCRSSETKATLLSKHIMIYVLGGHSASLAVDFLLGRGWRHRWSGKGSHAVPSQPVVERLKAEVKQAFQNAPSSGLDALVRDPTAHFEFADLAAAFFQWVNAAVAEAPPDRPPLLINMDETAIAWLDAKSRASHGAISTETWLEAVCCAIEQVLPGTSWEKAFLANGLLGQQQGVSRELAEALDFDGRVELPHVLPAPEAASCIFPARMKLDLLGYLCWQTKSERSQWPNMNGEAWDTLAPKVRAAAAEILQNVNKAEVSVRDMRVRLAQRLGLQDDALEPHKESVRGILQESLSGKGLVETLPAALGASDVAQKVYLCTLARVLPETLEISDLRDVRLGLGKMQEEHKGGDTHFHVAVLLSCKRRWTVAKRTLRARDHVASHWSASHTQFWSAVRYGAIATCEKPVIDEEPFADGEDWSLFEAAQQPWNAEVWRQRSENAERKRLCSASKATAKFSKLDLTALIVAKDLQTPAAVMAYTQDHGTRKMQEWVCQNQRKLGEYVEEASDWQQARDRSNAEKETEWALLCRMAGQACKAGSCSYARAAQHFFAANMNTLSRPELAHALRAIILCGPSKTTRCPIIVGPSNSGKTTLVLPFDDLFGAARVFHKPALNSNFPLVNLSKDKRFLFFDDFRPIEYAQGTIDVSTFLSLFNGHPFEIRQSQAFRNGNEDFAWRKGCCLTAKEKELWAPWGKVSEEVQHMKNRMRIFVCAAVLSHLRQTDPCVERMCAWIQDGAAEADAELVLQPSVASGRRQPARAGPLALAGMAELAAQAKLPNEKVEALSAELTALGAVHGREVSAADWTTLTAFNSLLPFERRRLLACL
ncbi:unnamed protein product, partial [Effrenium voratum]